jgi:hypothetical protein
MRLFYPRNHWNKIEEIKAECYRQLCDKTFHRQVGRTMEREPNDWRLTNQKRYLNESVLYWKRYKPSNLDNDHDHCEFCFAKFMEGNIQDTLRDGYTTSDGYHWICSSCFEDFKNLFKWKVKRLN